MSTGILAKLGSIGLSTQGLGKCGLYLSLQESGKNAIAESSTLMRKRPIYLGAGCTHWVPVSPHGDDHISNPSWVDASTNRRDVEKARANRLKHSLNGNPPKGSRKKKTKEEKKEVRVKRVVQLAKQQVALKSAKSKGMTKKEAQDLGRVIRGRGDYELGKGIGSKVGGWIGGKLHEFASRIFGGSGDYTDASTNQETVTANSMFAGSRGKLSEAVPAMHNSNGGGITLSHSEYIGTLGMTSAFKVTTFPIDPTSSDTFPWLSTIARRFQQYRPLGIAFYLRSLSSDTVIAPTQGMGSITAVVRYDVHSEAATDKRTMANCMGAVSDKPSVNQMVFVECDPKQTLLPIMKIRQPGYSPSELQFYMMGWLDIATEGAPNDYEKAVDLWGISDWVFGKPFLDEMGSGSFFFMDLYSSNVTQVLTPLADTPAVKQPRYDSIGLSLENDRRTVIFPLTIPTDSIWSVTVSYAGALEGTTASPVLSAGFSGGFVTVKVFDDQTTAFKQAPVTGINSGCGSQSVMIYFFKYNGNGTKASPPRLQISANSGASLSPYTGTIIIRQEHSAVATGLTSSLAPSYSRLEFFVYLCDVVSNRRATTPPPPGLGTIGDWVQQFKKTTDWPVTSVLPKSSQPFDLTFVEALSEITKYVDTQRVAKEGKSYNLQTDAEQKVREYELDAVLPAGLDYPSDDDWIDRRGPRVKGAPLSDKDVARRVRVPLNGARGDGFTGTDDLSCPIPGFVEDVWDLICAYAVPDAPKALPDAVVKRFCDFSRRNPNYISQIVQARKALHRDLKDLESATPDTNEWRRLRYAVTGVVRWCGFSEKFPDHSLYDNLPVRVMRQLIYFIPGKGVEMNVENTRYYGKLMPLLIAMNKDNLPEAPVFVIWETLVTGKIPYRSREFLRRQSNGARGDGWTGTDDVKGEAPVFTQCPLKFECQVSNGYHVHKTKSSKPDQKYSQALRRLIEKSNKEQAKQEGKPDKPRKPIAYQMCQLAYPHCDNPDHGHVLNDPSLFELRDEKNDEISVYEVQTQSVSRDAPCRVCHQPTPIKYMGLSQKCGNCENLEAVPFVSGFKTVESRTMTLTAGALPERKDGPPSLNPEKEPPSSSLPKSSMQLKPEEKKLGDRELSPKPKLGMSKTIEVKTEGKVKTQIESKSAPLVIHTEEPLDSKHTDDSDSEVKGKNSVAPVKTETPLIEDVTLESKMEVECKGDKREDDDMSFITDCKKEKKEAPAPEVSAPKLVKAIQSRGSARHMRQVQARQSVKEFMNSIPSRSTPAIKGEKVGRLRGLDPQGLTSRPGFPLHLPYRLNKKRLYRRVWKCWLCLKTEVSKDHQCYDNTTFCPLDGCGNMSPCREHEGDYCSSGVCLERSPCSEHDPIAFQNCFAPRVPQYVQPTVEKPAHYIGMPEKYFDMVTGEINRHRNTNKLHEYIRDGNRIDRWPSLFELPMPPDAPEFEDPEPETYAWTQPLDGWAVLGSGTHIAHGYEDHPLSLSVYSGVRVTTTKVLDDTFYPGYKRIGDTLLVSKVNRWPSRGYVDKLPWREDAVNELKRLMQPACAPEPCPFEGLTSEVVVYYTTDVRATQGLYSRVITWLRDRTPFLQKGVGYELNNNVGLTKEETNFVTENRRDTYTWGLPWSPTWTKKANFESVRSSDFSYLAISYYKSFAKVPIFDALYRYLNDISEDRVRDLHGRIFVRRVEGKKEGECEIVASSVAAVKSVALKYTDAPRLFLLESRIFCNTIHHFVQQSIVRGLYDVSIAGKVTGVAFGAWGSR